MRQIYIFILLLNMIFFSLNNLPHFIFDGIESFHECLNETEKLSFTIYGSFIGNVDLSNIKIDDYLIEDIGIFKCILSQNEEQNNKKRIYKISCNINGIFKRSGYILEQPKVHGFDFMTYEGESSWPKKPEEKTFLIGECGAKIELKDEQKFIISSLNNYSNPLSKIRKNFIDKIVPYLSKNSSLDNLKMHIEMKNIKDKYVLNEGECAYFVFRWITQNIEYDCYNLVYNTNKYDNDYITYNKGIGTSLGISLLFKKMCQLLGLETNIIVGYSKLSSFSEGIIPSKTDHIWNYIKIDSQYYLVDASNGAGFCDGETFIKNFNDFYFLPNPEFYNHLYHPVINKWQLLPNIITLEDFISKSLILDTFYEYGFNNIYPDSSIININEGKGDITLAFDESKVNINKNMMIFCEIFYLKNDIPNQVSNSCLVTKEKNKVKINIVVNDKQEYILIILAGPIYSKVYTEFEEIAFCKINSTKKVEKALSFPGITPSYLFSDIELIEPLYDSLKKGSLINFKIKAECFDTLYLMIGDKYIRELEKGEDGIFIGESVYIFGNKIKLYTKQGNNHKDILEYNTINDKNIFEEPSFPITYPMSSKSILFSPLNDTLKKGKNYFFKIKNKFSKEIVVLNGRNIIKLIKNGEIFSGYVTIDDNSNEVIIGENINNNNEPSIFYKYKIS